MLLTPDQLRELTGHKRVDAQVRELQHLGVPFRQRRDGSLVVLRSDLEPRTVVAGATMRPIEPELMP